MVDHPSHSLDGDDIPVLPSPPALNPHRTVWSYFTTSDDEQPSTNTTSSVASPNKRRRLFRNTGTNHGPSDNELVAVFPPPSENDLIAVFPPCNQDDYSPFDDTHSPPNLPIANRNVTNVPTSENENDVSAATAEYLPIATTDSTATTATTATAATIATTAATDPTATTAATDSPPATTSTPSRIYAILDGRDATIYHTQWQRRDVSGDYTTTNCQGAVIVN